MLPAGNSFGPRLCRNGDMLWALAALILGLLAAGATQAQQAKPATPPPAPPAEPALQAPLLDWSHGEHAFRLVERWVHRGRVDANPLDRPVQVSGLVAVRVTLRWLGKTMGAGQASPTALASGQATDLLAVVRQATAQALAETDDLLRSRNRPPTPGGTPRRTPGTAPGTDNKDGNVSADAAVPAGALTLERIGPRLLVDLQLAHSATRINLAADAKDTAIFYQFAPGFHGLRLTRIGAKGEPIAGWTWPASALAGDVPVLSQLRQPMHDVGYRVEDLVKAGRPGGPVVDRFQVIHLVRPTADQPVTRLVRGNVLVPVAEVNGATLDAMGQRLSQYLLRRQRDDGSMAGTYRPSSDQYDPVNAPAQDVALAAYALGKRAQVLLAADANNPEAPLLQQGARRAAVYLTRYLQVTLRTRPDSATTALLLMTLIETPQMGDFKIQRDWLAAQLLVLQNPDGSFRAGVVKDAPPLNRPTQALALAALSSLYEQRRDEPLLAAIRKSQTALWRDADPAKLTSLMPWLAVADSRMHRLTASPDQPADAPSAQLWRQQSAAIAALIDAVRQVQVTDAPKLGPADVLGGFDLANLPPDAPPAPDWRTAQILALFAVAMRDPDLAEGRNLNRWLIDCGMASRFLAQLMFDEPGCFYVRSVDDVVGGVRPTLWQNELSVAPTAMTLLAVSQFQQTLSALASHPGQ